MNLKHWLAQTTWLVLLALNSYGQGTAFIYQGHLHDGVSPAQGNYDLRFAIYDGNTNGNQVGSVLTNVATSVNNGLFAVTLDFGGIFTGANLWLDIGVRTTGKNAFTTLFPRQPITSVPYAIIAGSTSNLLGALPASQVSGTLASAQLPASVVTNGAGGLTLNGTFSGNGDGLRGIYSANLISDSTIQSIIHSSSAPSPSTNWAFHSMDFTTTNFLVTGGPISPTTIGAWGEYYGPAYYQSGRSSTNYQTPSVLSTTFGIDGSQVILRISGSGATWNVVVDGVVDQTLTTVPNDGSDHWYLVNFATAKTRTITLNNAWPFLGLYTPATYGFYSHSKQKLRRMVMLGDSFAEQEYAPGTKCLGVVSQLQLLLPQFDIWGLGEGGTGFINSGVAQGTNFIGRINDVVGANPEYVIIYGGINDLGYATNTSLTNILYVNTTNLIVSLKSRLPTAKISVVGPQWPRYAYPVGDAVVYNCALLLSNASATTGIPYINPIGEPWITGHPFIANSGNAPTYIRSEDGVHPSVPAGSKYLANKIVCALSQFWDFNAPNTNQFSNSIALSTNRAPTPAPGLGFLWNSNNALYWVTTLHTNLITGP